MRHALQRPLWVCSCGAPWPCEERRREYRAEIAVDGAGPVIAGLTGFYYDALMDRPDVAPRALYEQIVQWATT